MSKSEDITSAGSPVRVIAVGAGSMEEPLTTLVVTESAMPALKEAIARAMNTWQDPPQCIRDLDDIFTHGKVIDNSKTGK